MQSLLTDANRRIRPDDIEASILGLDSGESILFEHCTNVRATIEGGITGSEINGARVHVNSPHLRFRRILRHGQGDRPPAAADIEETARLWQLRRLRKELTGAQIKARRREDLRRDAHGKLMASRLDGDGAQIGVGGRHLIGEILFAHRHKPNGTKRLLLAFARGSHPQNGSLGPKRWRWPHKEATQRAVHLERRPKKGRVLKRRCSAQSGASRLGCAHKGVTHWSPTF